MFEFVKFVKCNMVTVTPNQIIIIIKTGTDTLVLYLWQPSMSIDAFGFSMVWSLQTFELNPWLELLLVVNNWKYRKCFLFKRPMIFWDDHTLQLKLVLSMDSSHPSFSLKCELGLDSTHRSKWMELQTQMWSVFQDLTLYFCDMDLT